MIQLVIQLDIFKGVSPFRFEKMWMRDSNLLEQILVWWKEVWIGNHSHLFSFQRKLSHIKAKLRFWNKEHFKNIFEESDKIESELRTLNEKVIEKGMGQEEFLKEKELLGAQSDILTRMECY